MKEPRPGCCTFLIPDGPFVKNHCAHSNLPSAPVLLGLLGGGAVLLFADIELLLRATHQFYRATLLRASQKIF